MRPSLRICMTAVLATALTSLAGSAGAADTDQVPGTERISVAPDGNGGNGHSVEPVVSADGRVVAFASGATNLVPGTDVSYSVYYRTAPGAPLQRVVVPGETTSTPQLSESGRYLTFNSYSATTGTSSVQIMDLHTGRIDRLAPVLDGDYHVSNGIAPISANGRYIAFVARPTIDEHGAFACQVMLLDRRTQQVRRVSRPSDGSKNFHQCQQISMSANGRKVAYLEGYSGPTDNDQGDIVVYDRVTGQTVQADTTYDGAPADKSAIAPVLTADGSKVAFNSTATNLVPGTDPNNGWNAFVRDLRTGTLQRYDGHSPTDLTLVSDLSADGSKLLLNTADANRRTLGLILRDLPTGHEDLLAPDQAGDPVTVGRAALSADESTVVFDSYYPGLVPDDTNLTGDVFVRTLH
ncbi:TolB family protein [Streptomyces sp. R21]|uniref:TolB family protein n=1 Tax=Streptomyces sp. R21 TaxID=3238627 RepID=A0AB39P0X6_9ACTN